jgi:four helix bundle protein
MDNRQDPFENLKGRTKKFALAVIKMVQAISLSLESDVLKRQIVKSATSIGSNYRSACRAR